MAPSGAIDYEPVPPLEVGESALIDLWGWCGVALEVGRDRYLVDRALVRSPGRAWRVSDFPPQWDVAVFNQEPADGPSWVIRNVTVERIDHDTLEMRDREAALIALFELDTTPPDQRITC